MCFLQDIHKDSRRADGHTFTSFMQPSKSVSMDSTKAPLAIGCTSCAMEILSAGRKTMEGMPACAQYAESAADVSPACTHVVMHFGKQVTSGVEEHTRSAVEPNARQRVMIALPGLLPLMLIGS